MFSFSIQFFIYMVHKLTGGWIHNIEYMVMAALVMDFIIAIGVLAVGWHWLS